MLWWNRTFILKYVLFVSIMLSLYVYQRNIFWPSTQAYRHNLRVLQSFGNDNFPLEKYIVNVDKDISPPSYLTEDSVFLISNGLPESDPNRKILPVEMLSNQEWPPREDFHLDESQFEAFRAALTKQMVVIQGPPGKLICRLIVFIDSASKTKTFFCNYLFKRHRNG